jgi:hypothetical protein
MTIHFDMQLSLSILIYPYLFILSGFARKGGLLFYARSHEGKITRKQILKPKALRECAKHTLKKGREAHLVKDLMA